MVKKPSILIVAPNASLSFGGEAFLPLKYFHLIHRRGHPVRLIAHVRNREELAGFLGDALAQVDFVADTAWHRAAWAVLSLVPKQLHDTLATILLNSLNEYFQARIIRQRISEGVVDVIHQPIPVSPLAPSGLYGYGVPTVIGPLNGGMNYPAGYEDFEGVATRHVITVSRAVARLLNNLIPGKRLAAALLVANERTLHALPIADHRNIIMLVENGVDLDIWTQPVETIRRDDPTVFRLVYIGRLVDWKAVDITLEALAIVRARGIAIRIDILGEGPERSALERRANQPDLAGIVHFHGFLPQTGCAAYLTAANALILNSLRECGGAVVLEAMAMSRPVIAADWGGPSDYLDDECGILVSPVPRGNFAARLADAICRLAVNPQLCMDMGTKGRQKVEQNFSWDSKIDKILSIYGAVTNKYHNKT